MAFQQAVHDHEHGGRTNEFLISTRDVLALTYNDKVHLHNTFVHTMIVNLTESLCSSYVFHLFTQTLITCGV